MSLGPEKKLQRQQRVLAVTRRLLGAVGYDQLTVAEIAQQSGVSIPTLYNRLGNKDQIVLAAILESYTQVLEKVRSVPSEGGLARVFTVLDTLLNELAQDPAYARELVRTFNQLARSDSGAGDAAVVGRELGTAYKLGLDELHERGDLLGWVPTEVAAAALVRSYSANMRSYTLSNLSFGTLTGQLRIDTCLILLGITRGNARAQVEAQLLRLFMQNASPEASEEDWASNLLAAASTPPVSAA